MLFFCLLTTLVKPYAAPAAASHKILLSTGTSCGLSPKKSSSEPAVVPGCAFKFKDKENVNAINKALSSIFLFFIFLILFF